MCVNTYPLEFNLLGAPLYIYCALFGRLAVAALQAVCAVCSPKPPLPSPKPSEVATNELELTVLGIYTVLLHVLYMYLPNSWPLIGQFCILSTWLSYRAFLSVLTVGTWTLHVRFAYIYRLQVVHFIWGHLHSPVECLPKISSRLRQNTLTDAGSFFPSISRPCPVPSPLGGLFYALKLAHVCYMFSILTFRVLKLF